MFSGAEQLMGRLVPILLVLLTFGACDGCRPIGPPHCPPCPCRDLGEPPRDFAVPRDLSVPADLSEPADMSCQPRLASCIAPLRCCPGLSCVGGLCAAVPTDL